MPQANLLNRTGDTLRHDVNNVSDDKRSEGQNHHAASNGAQRLLSSQTKDNRQYTTGCKQLGHSLIECRNAGNDDGEGGKVDQKQYRIAQKGSKRRARLVNLLHVVGYSAKDAVCDLDCDEHQQNRDCNQQNLAYNHTKFVIVKEFYDGCPPGIRQCSRNRVFCCTGQCTTSISYGIGSSLHNCLLLFS